MGKSEFDRNYILNYEKSGCEHASSCRIVYKFLPGEMYSVSGFLFYYDKNKKSIQRDIVNYVIPMTLPSCEKDLNSCNFVLSLEDLKEIARKEGLNDESFGIGMKDQKILIKASYCNLETMANRKKILIDPTNGEIVWRGSNRECQGII